MKLFRRKSQPNHVYTWESEPFAFLPGAIYVIEWDASKIQLKEVQQLTNFFVNAGINVHLVPTQGGNALNPVRVKRKKEQA
jgi:hypothetical protein